MSKSKDQKCKKNVLLLFQAKKGQERGHSIAVDKSFTAPRKFSSPRPARHFVWKKPNYSSSSMSMPNQPKRKIYRAARSGFNSSISSNNSVQIMSTMCEELNQGRFSQLLIPAQQQAGLVPLRKPSFYDSSSLRRSTPGSTRNSYAKNSFLGNLYILNSPWSQYF